MQAEGSGIEAVLKSRASQPSSAACTSRWYLLTPVRPRVGRERRGWSTTRCRWLGASHTESSNVMTRQRESGQPGPAYTIDCCRARKSIAPRLGNKRPAWTDNGRSIMGALRAEWRRDVQSHRWRRRAKAQSGARARPQLSLVADATDRAPSSRESRVETPQHHRPRTLQRRENTACLACHESLSIFRPPARTPIRWTFLRTLDPEYALLFSSRAPVH